MSFKSYFSAGARRVATRRKGRSDGRPTAAHFNRFVRRPFHERALANELEPNSRKGVYNVFDSTAVQRDLRGEYRRSNAAHLTSQNVMRQIKAENPGRSRRVASPNRKYLPIQ